MGRIAWLPVVALILAGTLAAQRSPFFATVVGPHGEPLAGAEVSCVFTPDVVTPWAADIVTVTTDERGRARCDLITGRLYVAWAIGSPDEAGLRHVSEPERLVAAGRVLELQALHRRAPHSVQLKGHEAWLAVGAAGLRWFPEASQDLHHDLPLPVGDALDLQPSPWCTGCLALTDASGSIMVATKVEPHVGSLPEFLQPMVVVARVTDTDLKPIAGATITYRVVRHEDLWTMLRSGFGRSRFERVVGTTAANGALRFHAPMPPGKLVSGKPPSWLPVFAHKAGFEPQSQVARDGEASLRLRPAGTTTVRLDGAEVPGIEMAAFRASMQGGLHRLDVECSTPTKWLVHAPGEGFILSIRALAKLPTAFVSDWVTQPPRELLVDIGALSRVEVQVLDVQGDPVACAIGVARPQAPIHWGAVLASDMRGRAELRLPAGDFYVYATNGTGHAVALIDRKDTGPVTLRLEHLPTMRVRVLNMEGRPVSGARASGSGASHGSRSNDKLDHLWDELSENLWWCYAPLARSNADGVMHIRAFVRAGLRPKIVVRAGLLSSMPFRLQPGGEAEVTLRKW